MRGVHRRPFGLLAMAFGALALSMTGCGGGGTDAQGGDTGGSAPDSSGDAVQGGGGSSQGGGGVSVWGADTEDALSEVASPGGGAADVPAGPDEPEVGTTEPEVGTTEPDPQPADVSTGEEDVSVPLDVGSPPVFEGDATTVADPTDPLLCTVSGAANDVVDCELHMATQAGSNTVAALEFHFPLAPYAELVGISCPSGGGVDTCNGNMKGPLPTGYTYNASYSAASGASMIVFGLNAPSPLSPGVYDGATVTGATFVLSFRLKFLMTGALEVRVPDPIFSDIGGTSLSLEVVDGVWVTSGG